jgi:IAA-amino acid hydrolase
MREDMKFDELIQHAEKNKDWILNLRRQIHRHPELMYEEVETSKLIQSTLSELGVEFKSGLAETGVLGTIGGGDGPCVALRADMDALPIHEQTDVEFRSEVDGKMHACGHDCHTAMLLGAAKILKERESEIRGTVKLVFQPAEEGGAGGKRMRDEGALSNPDVQRIFGLHVWPMVPTGTITSRAGTFLAATTSFEITIKGKGGHAAMPNLAIDPVVTAAKLVADAQTIVSRENDPLTPLVISFTAIKGGEAFNVIPSEVTIRGTIRSLTTEHLGWGKERLSAMTKSVAETNQCEGEIEFRGNDYPATVNDGELWDFAQSIWKESFAEETTLESPPIMGGEDFAFYTEQVPGCFVGLGIRNESIGATYSVHHPMFKVDEDALPLGSALHVGFALKSLAELAKTMS